MKNCFVLPYRKSNKKGVDWRNENVFLMSGGFPCKTWVFNFNYSSEMYCIIATLAFQTVWDSRDRVVQKFIHSEIIKNEFMFVCTHHSYFIMSSAGIFRSFWLLKIRMWTKLILNECVGCDFNGEVLIEGDLWWHVSV